MSKQEFVEYLKKNSKSGMHEIVQDWDDDTKTLEEWLLYLIDTMSDVMQDLAEVNK